MLLLIVKREIVHNVISFRFMVTNGLLCCLVLLSVYLMTNDYQARFQTYTTEINSERARLGAIDDVEDPSEQFQQWRRSSLVGVRQPQLLSIFAKGLDGLLPAQSQTQSRFSSDGDRLSKNLLLEIFQTPDFVYVVNLVISLLVLLFVFDAVSGEKERGSLKLLLSNSVPRDTVLIGKWIGGYLSITLPFSVAALAGLTYAYGSGAFDLQGEGLTRFVAIFVVSLLYISAFFTLGLMISVLTHRSSTALLLSLLVWICWILVVPNLAPVVARLVSPVPSRLVIDAEIKAMRTKQRLMVESHRSRGDLISWETFEKDVERQTEILEEFYREKLNSQTSITQNLARLSPSASYLFATTRLAGTGATLAEHFDKAERRFRKDAEDFNSKAQQGVAEWGRRGPVMKDPDWFNIENVPRFEMFEERLSDSLDAVMTDILLLIIYNVVFFMTSYLFFLRYDVT